MSDCVAVGEAATDRAVGHTAADPTEGQRRRMQRLRLSSVGLQRQCGPMMLLMLLLLLVVALFDRECDC